VTENGTNPLGPLWQQASDVAALGDFPGLVSAWESLVQKGVWQLNARIGEIYERGVEGVERDIQKALTWYRKGVFEGDDPLAHVGLGRAYLKGSGIKQDYAMALKHFEKAYASGSREAHIYLGVMHSLGAGVRKDLDRAQQYFEVAAASEYFIAYAFLARLAFERGRVVRAVMLIVRSWFTGARISKRDPTDPKLLGMEKIGSSKLDLLRTILFTSRTAKV